MTKTIVNIVQNDSGGTNPDTHAHEDKIWELTFEDNDTTNLTRMKMMELLTKGTVPTKTVHSFRKWELTTTHGAHIRTWVIVYDDKSHVQLTNNDFIRCYLMVIVIEGKNQRLKNLKKKVRHPLILYYLKKKNQ